MAVSLQRRAAPIQLTLTLKEGSRFWFLPEPSFCFLLLENLTHPASLPGPCPPDPLMPCTNRRGAHIPGWYAGDTAFLSPHVPTAACREIASLPMIAHISLSQSCSLQTSAFGSDGLHKAQLTDKNRNAELPRTQENVAQVCPKPVICELWDYKWSEIIKGTTVPLLPHMEGTLGGGISKWRCWPMDPGWVFFLIEPIS